MKFDFLMTIAVYLWSRGDTGSMFMLAESRCIQYGKKIGIVTYHRAINYGAVLQVTALQNHLIKKNYDVLFRSMYLVRA